MCQQSPSLNTNTGGNLGLVVTSGSRTGHGINYQIQPQHFPNPTANWNWRLNNALSLDILLGPYKICFTLNTLFFNLLKSIYVEWLYSSPAWSPRQCNVLMIVGWEKCSTQRKIYIYILRLGTSWPWPCLRVTCTCTWGWVGLRWGSVCRERGELGLVRHWSRDQIVTSDWPDSWYVTR